MAGAVSTLGLWALGHSPVQAAVPSGRGHTSSAFPWAGLPQDKAVTAQRQHSFGASAHRAKASRAGNWLLLLGHQGARSKPSPASVPSPSPAPLTSLTTPLAAAPPQQLPLVTRATCDGGEGSLGPVVWTVSLASAKPSYAL